MKNYIKPEITNVNYSANCAIAAGLEGWLSDNNMTTYDQAITTFAYNS